VTDWPNPGSLSRKSEVLSSPPLRYYRFKVGLFVNGIRDLIPWCRL